LSCNQHLKQYLTPKCYIKYIFNLNKYLFVLIALIALIVLVVLVVLVDFFNK
jgi:hypothetical protein